MKQKLMASLCLILLVLLCACSSVPTSTSKITANPTPLPKLELTPKEEMTSRLIILIRYKKAFEAGTYIPGEIPEGEYAYIGINNSKKYSEESISGSVIVDEEFQSFGYVYVYGNGNVDTDGILVNVDSFEQLGINGAQELYEIMTEQSEHAQGGMYKVGTDVPSGSCTVKGLNSGTYIIRNGPFGNGDSIQSKYFFDGRKQIEIEDGQYLELRRAIISE